MGEPSVRRAARRDEAGLADLHCRVFPHYASSALGRRFCASLLHAYRSSDDALVLVVDGADSPVGYLVGAKPAAQREVNRAMRGRAVRAAVARCWRPGAWPHLASPAVRVRVVNALRRRPHSQVETSAASGPDAPGSPASFRVVLIGVEPATRGGGAADALLSAFADEARGRGDLSAELVVAAGNAAARRCYERNGWSRVDAGRDETGSARYRLDLAVPGGLA